ncbi:ParM/StbA family protein [Oscillibacter valericigenes]|uniref:ParM/StbA family protein n=1 Tax=Oscillibacter valericigenes TaxID=351091 RepID=UPI001F36F4AC|nr:ParM/StbA family protein [Oscillibacter valericigenes]MCF2617301.1 ParM/StbA family protein [Oscillibacter valericigenes]
MIISVDHGNKSIKTPHAIFTSGLVMSDGLQGFKTDYIGWNGKYYSLTERRISYLRDKTEDDRFFILTLFAIAKELEYRDVSETLDPIDITLLVGLPPAHYEQLHSRFEQYFLRRREAIDFEYNGKYYSVRINKVLSYPQAFAAAVTQYSTLKVHSVAYIIDIGGFTIDVLKLRFGRPDLEVVESFEKGVITLYNSIASKCNSQYARILEECEIDEVIRNQPTVLPGEVQQLIRIMTSDFLAEFYNFLRERGIDVSTSKCVFAGGGSLLLRGMIERGNKVAFPIFIEDIHANAIGYEVLYQSEVASSGKQ